MKIFISHSSRDQWVAREISRQLYRKGHSTFLDEKDIMTGDSINDKIQKHLKESDQLLIIISPSSLKSHWVFIEIGGARVLGIKIVPILLHVEPNEIPNAISSLLARDINEIERYYEELSAISNGKQIESRVEAENPKKMIDGFKIGDKVKIINMSYLTEEDKARSPKWTDPMNKYSDVVTKIIGFTKEGNVSLSADNSEFRWSPRWINKHDK